MGTVESSELSAQPAEESAPQDSPLQARAGLEWVVAMFDRCLLFSHTEWFELFERRLVVRLFQVCVAFIFLVTILDDSLAGWGFSSKIEFLIYIVLLVLFTVLRFFKMRNALFTLMAFAMTVLDWFTIQKMAQIGGNLFTDQAANMDIYILPITVLNAAFWKPRVAMVVNAVMIGALLYGAAVTFAVGIPAVSVISRMTGLVMLAVLFTTVQFFAVRIYTQYRAQLVEARHLVAEMQHRQRLAEENQKIREDLDRAQRVRLVDSMTSSMAHEIAGPLSNVLNFTQAARRWLRRAEPDTEEAAAALDGAIGEIGRVEARVGTIRRLMRGLTGEYRYLDLVALLHEVEVMVAEGLSLRGIAFRLHLPQNQKVCEVYGCAEELIQVLLNLIANAADAFPATGDSRSDAAIQVELCEGADEVFNIIVHDNGCGIDAADLPRVFDRLYTTKSNGSGLGLSLSRRIAENHGGDLVLSSERGRGTSAQLCLPSTILGHFQA